MERKERQQRQAERVGRAQVFAGLCVEAAGYAGVIVEIQRRGLKTWHKFVPEPVVTREFLLQAVPQLNSAVTAVSKALEQLRFSEPDLEEPAGALFDAVMDVYSHSLAGDATEIEVIAARIRQLADDLRELAGE